MLTTNIAFAIMVIGALYYFWRFYILFLVNLVENKQYNWFKIFTFCRWELRLFVRKHMMRDDIAEAETIGLKR